VEEVVVDSPIFNVVYRAYVLINPVILLTICIELLVFRIRNRFGVNWGSIGREERERERERTSVSSFVSQLAHMNINPGSFFTWPPWPEKWKKNLTSV
jgi:hypothetical protein